MVKSMISKTQILKLLAGSIILFILVMKVGVKNIFKILSSFNFIFIMPLILLYLLSLVLGAVCLKILLNGVKKEISLRCIVKAYLLSSMIGVITPGRIGEFSLVYFLRKYNIPIGTSAAVSVLDKIITLIILMAFSVWGSFIFMEHYITIMILAASITGAMIVWFIFISKTGRNLIKIYLFRKITDKIKGFSKTLNELAKEKMHILYNVVLTVIRWLLHFASFYVTFFAFGVKLPIFSLLLLAIVALIALIPITFGGLGVKEAAAVYLFKYVGIKPEIVLSVFLFIFVIKYLSNFAIMLYLAKER